MHNFKHANFVIMNIDCGIYFQLENTKKSRKKKERKYSQQLIGRIYFYLKFIYERKRIIDFN